MSEWPFGDTAPGTVATVLADPPWRFRMYSEKNLKKSPQGKYACMDMTALAALPVAELCQRDATVVLWTTAPFLPQAFTLMNRWGFAYKTAGAWAKQSKTGQKLAFGTGYIYRSAAEFWVVGSRGKPKTQSNSVRNLIVAPVREHSRKPDQMRRDVEALFPGPYFEMFGRESAPNWTVWGNESNKFDPPLDLAA